MNKISGPKWPFILGPLISLAGTVMGYTIPVGRRCSGAFASDHAEAVGYDIAHAQINGIRTYFAEACEAAAPAQTGIYWGMIGFGLAIVILGAVLKSVAARKPVAAVAASSGAVSSVADEITQLAALRERGILTAGEFEAEKQRVLRR